MTRSDKLARIQNHLAIASILADELALEESNASDPFTELAQKIDYAIAKAEGIVEEA